MKNSFILALAFSCVGILASAQNFQKQAPQGFDVLKKAESTQQEEKGEEHKIDIINNDESTDLITEEKEEVIEKTAE